LLPTFAPNDFEGGLAVARGLHHARHALKAKWSGATTGGKMKTGTHFRRVAALGGIAVGLFTANGCTRECTDDGVTAVCGEFGSLRFSNSSLIGVRWPAVVAERSSLIVSVQDGLQRIDPDGSAKIVQEAGASETTDDGVPILASAPSMDDDGNTFVALADGSLRSFSDFGGTARWVTELGSGAASPPAIGRGVVHVTTTTTNGQGRALLTLDAVTGATLANRNGASAPVILEDDSLVYMSGTTDCGATHEGIVVEDADHNVLFQHQEDSGVRDFAPGPHGEFYVVNGDRQLVRLSANGEVDWTFSPDCDACSVAGAPTVTGDAIYFPVWDGPPPNSGCGDLDPTNADDEEEALGLDPLYALGHDGKQMWVYDGFVSTAQRHSDGASSTGLFGLALNTKVRHHPAGRPVIADDGTLYVPADGGIVALDKDGKELGYALFEPMRGEVGVDGMFGSSTLGSNEHPLVLGDDGVLYHFDGATVRAFETNKSAAKVPWTAPFGGRRNASRFGG
jgi:outer membrane protein assembly factor BamB